MHLGLRRALYAPYQIMGARGLTKVPDGPQAYISNILRLQEGAAQVHMSE